MRILVFVSKAPNSRVQKLAATRILAFVSKAPRAFAGLLLELHLLFGLIECYLHHYLLHDSILKGEEKIVKRHEYFSVSLNFIMSSWCSVCV